MQVIRGCLMSLGLIMLLMITSCVVGVSGCSRALNPTEYSRSIDETPEKTRRMLREWLETATVEQGTLLVQRRAPTIALQDYSDGSIHLTVSQDKAVLLELVARVAPRGDRTRVDVHVDGAKLARSIDDVSPATFHRELKSEIEHALAAIDEHRVMPQGLLLSRTIREAQGYRR